jgi:FHS family L-fucose permease-like MFS transporter
VFLTGLFTLGVGLSILQTAANPYVTILGDKERAAQRFSIMGISNKVAGIIAPLLFAAIILKPEDKSFFENLSMLPIAQKEAALDELVGRVVVPYMVIGFILVALGLLVKYSPLPEIDSEKETDEQRSSNNSKTSVLSFPYLVLGSVAIFFHVGSQVIAVDSVINHTRVFAGNNIYPKSTKPVISFTNLYVFRTYIVLGRNICYRSYQFFRPLYGCFCMVFSRSWIRKFHDMGRRMAISLK